jgi:hypothetical protein
MKLQDFPSTLLKEDKVYSFVKEVVLRKQSPNEKIITLENVDTCTSVEQIGQINCAVKYLVSDSVE